MPSGDATKTVSQVQSSRYGAAERTGGEPMADHTTGERDAAAEAMAAAIAHHRAGRLDQAERLYRQVLQGHPGHLEALHLLGVVAFQAGNAKAAESLIGRALAGGLRSAEACNNYGNALRMLGRHDQAIASYRQALALAPGYANAHSNLGVALHESGDLEPAIASYRRAIELQPGNAGALNNLGAALQQAGRHAEAIELFQRAVAAAPDHADAHRNLGSLLLEERRRDEAIAAFAQAAALEPRRCDLRISLAGALAGTARYEEAIASLEEARRLEPGNRAALLALGQACWAIDARERALEAFQAALALDPGCADALVGLAHLEYRDQAPEQATALLERAVAAEPGHRRARFYLAMLRDLAGDAAAAAGDLEALAAEGADFLVDSWRYAREHRGARTRFFASGFDTLRHCLALAPVEGLVLEFGVLFGRSLRLIASHCERPVHGFDSFEGLPEAWGRNPAGAYSAHGRLPEVAGHVRLHAGWFEDTLPAFLAGNPGPVAFMNVDCDLYSSTRTILDRIAARLVPGSVVVFDEYLCTGQWREDEYKAFQEAVARHGWRYEYLAFNLFAKQAAVIIL
jgi:tetratricopeptide (TPR) repeat protein